MATIMTEDASHTIQPNWYLPATLVTTIENKYFPAGEQGNLTLDKELGGQYPDTNSNIRSGFDAGNISEVLYLKKKFLT